MTLPACRVSSVSKTLPRQVDSEASGTVQDVDLYKTTNDLRVKGKTAMLSSLMETVIVKRWTGVLGGGKLENDAVEQKNETFKARTEIGSTPKTEFRSLLNQINRVVIINKGFDILGWLVYEKIQMFRLSLVPCLASRVNEPAPVDDVVDLDFMLEQEADRFMKEEMANSELVSHDDGIKINDSDIAPRH
ncbi:hypothetical protein PsorP6_000725 [Peronosclerospora sorghi]|uniref:Uncharacterized protein n=1 Tax=Peronosclerospora sorghi TaxID=230839 RepID=A0ACC0WYX7_9STRA|nr:hypothetical protein PsorP6_000725 [Peronosclerospora sorghi]